MPVKKKTPPIKKTQKKAEMESLQFAEMESLPLQFTKEQILSAMNLPFNSTVELSDWLIPFGVSAVSGTAIDHTAIDNSPRNNSLALSSILQLILDTPNYKRQVALIDSILSSLPPILHALLFHKTVLLFPSIPSDRKDKFFYLLKKTLPFISFRYVSTIPVPEVTAYIWSLVQDRTAFTDWDDKEFIEYAINAKPFILKSIKRIRIEKEIIKEYLDLPMSPITREFLYLIGG